MKRVLDVGNCGPDHASIRAMLTANFDVQLDQADQASDALQHLQQHTYDLILVNRKLDCDYSDGIEVIRAIKAEAAYQSIPTMMVTNFAEHQEAAQQAGAVLGFGKSDLQSPETVQRLGAYLAEAS